MGTWTGSGAHMVSLPPCSGANGYLLPLSGGADSASTAAIVGKMAQMVIQAAIDGDATVAADARRCTAHPTPSLSLCGFPVKECVEVSARVPCEGNAVMISSRMIGKCAVQPGWAAIGKGRSWAPPESS